MNPLTRLSRATIEPVAAPARQPPIEISKELDFPKLFRGLERHYDKGKATLERFSKAEEKGGFLRKGRSDYLRALNGVLSTLLDSYTAGIYSKSKEDLQEVDARLEKERHELDELRHQLLFAVPGKGAPSMMDRALLRDYTLNSEVHLGKRIATAEKQIELLEVSRAKILIAFCKEMQNVYRWSIDEKQATVLLYQANGESIVQAVEVVRIVTQIESMLAKLRKQSANPDNLRKYYGMAVMTRLMVLLMYEAHIADYDQKWFPALKRREDSNEKLMTETRALMKGELFNGASAQLIRNQKIQKNTAAAIAQYTQVLLQRLQRTKEARDTVAMEAELALNTFKTLEDAIGFAADVAAFDFDHDALSTLLPSDLVPLDDDDLAPLYREISLELHQK